MNVKILSLLAAVLIVAQPVFAGADLESSQQHLKKEVSAPSAQAQLGEKGPDASPEPIEMIFVPAATTTLPAVAGSMAYTKVAQPTQHASKPSKVLSKLRDHEGGSSVLGIL